MATDKKKPAKPAKPAKRAAKKPAKRAAKKPSTFHEPRYQPVHDNRTVHDDRTFKLSKGALAGVIDGLGGMAKKNARGGPARVVLTEHEVYDMALSGQAYSLDGKFNIVDTTGELAKLREVWEKSGQGRSAGLYLDTRGEVKVVRDALRNVLYQDDRRIEDADLKRLRSLYKRLSEKANSNGD